MPTAIVILAGPAGVGKSTTARALADLYASTYSHGIVQRLAFAGPLYELVGRLTGLPVEELHRRKEVPLTANEARIPLFVGKTPRKLLQMVGEGMRQIFGPTYWIEQAWARVNPSADVVVFEDGRHAPELRLGIVVELRRAGIGYACDHPSAMPPPGELVWRTFNLDERAPERAAKEILAGLILDKKLP